MRIWDLSPGYLNRQSLLGEHRELHGLVNILVHGKTGYSRHPETRRWVGCVTGLVRRHAVLAAEMRLRGYVDRTPLAHDGRPRWPATYVTAPPQQFALLRSKYIGRTPGRIPLPRSVQQLWAQHKYSVMARDPDAYRSIGRRAARLGRSADLRDLSIDLLALLREDPPRRRLVNALEHMWGHVSSRATAVDRRHAQSSPRRLLETTQALAVALREPYLMGSTALAELAVFVADADGSAPEKSA